jgi:nucleoside-diphosphate-sugar epimerase
MTIVCTGGSGFLGSALCNRLNKLGYDVCSFDNFSRESHQSNLDHGIYVWNGDIRNMDGLTNFVQHEKPDTLWHLAYINGTKTFYSHPELVLEVGVKGAINTLDVALNNNIKNYFLVSSSEVYNEPSQVPTLENERMIIPDVYNPRFSYSGGKIISELLAIHYGAKQGLNVKIFRPHNIYGPNMGLEHVIPEIVKKIIKPQNARYIDDQLVVNVQGTGEETRAFCYIDDAIDEMILASQDNSLGTPTYNIGVQNETSIKQLVYLIAEILGVAIILEPSDKIKGSTNRRCPDMSKLNQLGYQPKHSLYDGLKKTVEWYKEIYNG